MSNNINVENYRWHCAALSASHKPAANTFGVKRAAATKATRMATRAWNGSMT